jgi:hypothetical protein
MTPTIELIYFSDCPHVPAVKQLLARYKLAITEICQDSLTIDSPYRGYSSPTILIDNMIALGGRTAQGSGACSLLGGLNFDWETSVQIALASFALPKPL